MNYIYVSRGKHLYECSVIYLSEKKHPPGLELLVFFTFINYFWKHYLITNIITARLHVFEQFTYVLVCKNICQASLPLFLLLLAAIFCLDQTPKGKANGNCLFNNSVSLSLVGRNSMAHKRRVMAAVKIHLNATYAQHLALKSGFEKRQYEMGGKLFSSKIMFEL